MKKRILVISIVIMLTISMISCQTADILTGEATLDKDWDLMLESASNTTVNLYLTQSDEEMRAWFSSKLYKHLSENFGITLNVRILSYDEIEYTLERDSLNENKDGDIDLLVLRDDEFRRLKDQMYLYPEISDKVPNLMENINLLDSDVGTEHGYPLEGFAIPFGREQFVLMFDEDELEIYPTSTDELLSFLKDNPETFTYPNPVLDETGGEFIRTVVFERLGQETLNSLLDENLTEAQIEELLMPAINYLKELDTYVLKNDGQYFTSIEGVDEQFKNGSLFFSMTQDFSYATDAINNEVYPDGAKAFIFESGTIMDTLYFAVPMNASNKTGSIVTINEMLSIPLQLDKYIPSNWGQLPILDLNLMPEADAESFAKASVKRNTTRVEELANARYYELPVEIKSIINGLWEQHINQ